MWRLSPNKGPETGSGSRTHIEFFIQKFNIFGQEDNNDDPWDSLKNYKQYQVPVESGSQHPHCGSQLPMTPASRDSMASLDSLGTSTHMHIPHMQVRVHARVHTHTQSHTILN